MNRVLDACALIALLRGEEGCQTVRQILTDPQSVCYAHAVNLHEVYRDFLRSAGQADAAAAIAALRALNIGFREDLDEALWMDAAHRRYEHRMSMADAVGIALANRLSADFVSADHHELDAVDRADAYVITFIR